MIAKFDVLLTSLSVCGVMCVCSFNNQGGLVQQLLAHKGWVPLSRLTFGAYLLHPLVSSITVSKSCLCVCTAPLLDITAQPPAGACHSAAPAHCSVTLCCFFSSDIDELCADKRYQALSQLFEPW
jgi:hypothetical protein